MSKRLYYSDAYTTTFESQIVERIHEGDRLGVVLESTFFYPTSGGQPCDFGTINHVPVNAVEIRENDDAIIHWLSGAITADQANCIIDWNRRFDHMQQHSGQHILTAIIDNAHQARTIGFHLGAEASTIDLDIHELLPEQVLEIEALANEIITANRKTKCTMVSVEAANRLSLRKAPPAKGPVRIVEIEELDVCACGGTHVRQTGEIGLLKITRLEKRTKGLRIEFLCGKRALIDYNLKHNVITQVSNDLSIGVGDLQATMERMQQEAKSLRREVKKAKSSLLEYQARELLQSADTIHDLKIVSHIFSELDGKALNWMAKRLTDEPSAIVLLGVAGSRSHILFARANNIDLDMRPLLQNALEVLGNGSGGGQSQMAQGGGPTADVNRLNEALESAKRLLLTQKSSLSLG